MQRIVRVRRIANPSSRRRKSTASTRRRKRATPRRRHRSRSKNPLRVITLGAINPRRAKVKRRRKASTTRRRTTRRRNASYTARPRRRTGRATSRRRNATRIVVRRNRRRRRNQLGGAVAGQVQEIFGGLVGVSATKFIAQALGTNMPNLTATPIMASMTSIGAAFVAGWLGGMWDRRFGNAVRFGGLMQAGSVMLNAFIPAIGGQLSLRGMRGLGDLVPGAYPVPQNPLNPGQANYPAYGRPMPIPAGNGNGTFGPGAPVTMNGVARAFGRAF